MSHLTTCEASRNATSSPELASGLIHCGSPDGLTINQSGLAPARASLSARQAKEMGLLTSGTFGPTSSTSSASADLSMSLANRLQQVTQTYGSTLYKLTRKEWDTPSGLCRLRQRASVRRTSESGPTAAHAGSEHESAAGNETGVTARLRSSSTDRLANTSGERLNRVDSLLQREESGRLTKSVLKAAGHSVTGGMGYADNSRLERHIGDDSAAGREGQAGPATPPGVHMRALEVNGFWRDADWLLCRDGKWRPVEPGTFPLVDGAAARLGRVESGVARVASSNRVGRLKGYGNAINAQAAAEFIRAYMGVSYGR